jgi:hypothetical protein
MEEKKNGAGWRYGAAPKAKPQNPNLEFLMVLEEFREVPNGRFLRKNYMMVAKGEWENGLGILQLSSLI